MILSVPQGAVRMKIPQSHVKSIAWSLIESRHANRYRFLSPPLPIDEKKSHP